MFSTRSLHRVGLFVLPLFSLLCLGAAPASASTEDRLTQFAQRHGLTNRHLRVFERQVGKRTIKRIFVPVFTDKAEMGQDFVKTFTASKKRIVLHAYPTSYQQDNHPYDHYVRAAFGPKDVWASHYDDGVTGPKVSVEKSQQALMAVNGSRFVVMTVGKNSARYAENMLTTFHKTSSYSREGQAFVEAMEAAGHPKGNIAAECMWWLPNLKTSDKRNVMQKAGTKMTKAPQMMPSILIHSAKNEVVEVVGVGVKNKSEFNRMSESKLFGPEAHRAPDYWVVGNK